MISRPCGLQGSDSRRGITIVETIVLMTVAAAMLGLCTMLIQLLMKLDAEGRARVESSATLGRLSQQLRADAHGNSSAAIKEGAEPARQTLRFEGSSNRTIEYQVKGDGTVFRTESEGGKTVSQERYEVQRSGSIDLKLDQEGDRQLVRLTVHRRLTRIPEEPERAFEIVAAVGRNKDRKAAGGKP